MMSVWRHYYVEEEEDNIRYYQNFLLCNNNEITAFIADLFNSFCEEVCICIFQRNAATNYRWSGKFNNTFVGK